jgi:DDE_Tnp_1-associated
MKSLAEALKDVVDHRKAPGKRHELSALLVLMCTGMLCGSRSLQALTGWGKRQEGALLRAMGFARGTAPGYGTLQCTVKQLVNYQM